MRISFNWLKQYIDLNTTAEEVAAILTGIGLEVESIEHLGRKFDGFVVGEVVSVEKHPNADRLSVCKVLLTPGGEPKQIVCGAPNVAAGQKVVVGLPGAVVPSNQHDPAGKPFVLAETKIRGVESNGMICSESELGIGDDKSGIKVLDPSAKIGESLSDFLGLNDVAMEIGVTPNRPDCLSHIGVARDLAGKMGKPIRLPESTSKHRQKTSVTTAASVEVKNTVACPRYSARVIRNVTVQESPKWMQQRLTAAGLRPINNIVDVTNFVMLEYGQPLHAFDLDRLSNNKIIVTNSTVGQPFTTLDGKKHTLSGTELMICDGEKAVAIGGVMGGENSEISTTTKNVLLECAYFDPGSVRNTSKKLGISSDASYRFERGTDPNKIDDVSRRAAVLMEEVSGGEMLDGVIDVYPEPIKSKEIAVRPARVNQILGTTIAGKDMLSILRSLGFSPQEKKNDTITCTIPTYRPDVTQEIDLIEEIARLFGYDNIPNETSGTVVLSEPSASESRLSDLRKWLQCNGCNEVVTNSLIDESTARIFSDRVVKVKNPLSIELEVMRPKLLPSLLQSVAYNYNHGADSLRFFEVGSTFAVTPESQKSSFISGISENKTVGIVFSGFTGALSWYEKQREFDIYDMKGFVLSLIQSAGIDNIHLIYYDASSSLTEQSIGVEIHGTYAGSIGKCSAQLLNKFKIEKDVFFAELDVDVLFNDHSVKKYSEYSKYPTVVRDVAFVLNKDIPVKDVESTIKKSGGDLVTGITLFDVFSGSGVGDGKKSVAFSIRVNSTQRTLKDTEIDEIVSRIISAVTSAHGATHRSM